ncbi:MAG: hypothetical protein KDJ27_17030 [Gammaproteobacteria bacterium]|nr:hypothetical protein [Gammaproteobacteria bacterium]
MRLLAIIELGGYPNLLPLYQRLGFEVDVVNSQRKARSYLKKTIPDVIVAEYIFQSDFRDRTSNLETLMAVLQKQPHVKVVVFYLQEQAQKLALLEARFPLFAKIPFPITADKVEASLQRIAAMAAGHDA